MPIAFLVASGIFLANGICSEQASHGGDAGPGDGRTQRSTTMKPLSILGWYRILRSHHHWTVFQSVRYAVWLAR
jgi:hypothetical protein